MSRSNPILRVAEGILENGLTPSDLDQQVDALLRQGVGAQEIQKALEIILTPTSPTPLVEVVGQICVVLASATGHSEVVRAIHFALANLLDERYDRLSLLLAVQHYQKALERLARASRNYGLMQGSEGNARLRLAKLGVEPEPNLTQAISLYQQARDSFDPASPYYGGTQVSEGYARSVLAEFGVEPVQNLTQAIHLCQQARERLDPSSSVYGSAQMNEGIARCRSAEFGVEPVQNLTQAIGLFQQARGRFDPSDPDYGRAWMNEGSARCTLADLGVEPVQNLTQAIHLCQQARERFDPASPDYGRVQANEGNARGRLADLGVEPQTNLTEASILYKLAGECFEPGSPDWGTTRRNQARVLKVLGRHGEAYERLEEGLQVVEGMRATMRREQERIAFLETMAGQYAAMVGLCLDLAETAPAEQAKSWRWRAWHWVHRGKSRTLLELLANVRPLLTDQDRPLWEEYEEITRRLDEREREIRLLKRMLQEGRSPYPSRERLDRATEAHKRARQAYDEKRQAVLERIEGARAFQTVDVPPPVEVVRSLRTLADANGVSRPLLVEFFTLSATELLVFLLPLWENGPPVVERVRLEQGGVRLMTDTLLEGMGTLRQKSRARRQGEAREVSEGECQAALLQLEQLPAAMTALLEPWAHHLERWQPTHLFLSPHYFLNLLPLHAALWKGQPLNEHFPISYLPSPALAGEMVRRRRPLHGEALLLGNPTEDLGGAEREVAWVTKSLERERIGCRAFLREAATTDKIYTHAPTAGIVHTACHSSLDQSDFLESGLELADRKLRAFDVAARLQLQRATLVYLGSCESGRAVPGRTDELMALMRVFLYAGSPAVIATLWDLHDGAGSYFADYFYRYWITEKRRMAVAFQMAMKETRNHYENPFYWAPFVLMGG